MKYATFLLALLGPLAAAAWSAELHDTKPNVLLFLVDDMGMMDTSLPLLVDQRGNPKPYPLNEFYRTPNVVRLASRGTCYSQFYADSVCSPTRTSLMNGQFSARHNTTQFISPERKNTGAHGPDDWKWEGFTEDEPTLPAQLKAAGYRTIHAGKAHFGPVGAWAENPLNLGFDVNIAGCAYGQPGSYLGQKHYGNGIENRQKRAVPGLEKYHGTETHLTEALTLEMIEAISTATEMKQPFFAYMSHYAVHAPFEADDRFVDNYREGNTARLAAFASLIEGVDKSLGDLLDHLNSIGVAENTLVIFLGDNGTDAPIGDPHAVACAAPLRGKKGTHYEGGMRVPCIVAWGKNDPANRLQSNHPVLPNHHISLGFGHICDVYATILDITATKPAEGHHVDGISLLPSLRGVPLPNDRQFLMHFPHKHRSSYFTVLRQGDHKLVYHYPVPAARANPFPRVELFNLAADPKEKTNLAESNPALRREMIAALAESLENSGAQYPLIDNRPVRPQSQTR